MRALSLWREKLAFLRESLIATPITQQDQVVSLLAGIREAETYVAQYSDKPKPSQFSLQYIVAMKTDSVALKEALVGERALVLDEIAELETKYAISSDASNKWDLRSEIQVLNAYRSNLDSNINQL